MESLPLNSLRYRNSQELNGSEPIADHCDGRRKKMVKESWGEKCPLVVHPFVNWSEARR